MYRRQKEGNVIKGSGWPPSDSKGDEPQTFSSGETKSAARVVKGLCDGMPETTPVAADGAIDQGEQRKTRKISSKRAHRYVEATDKPKIFMSKNLNKIRPYYDGTSVDRRMSEVRESIVFIREHWDDYQQFNEELRRYTEDIVTNSEAKQRLECILATQKDWAKKPEDVTDDTFDTLRLYTSARGYNEIFSLIGCVFRDEESTQQKDLMIRAVFIVELVNIDLFNYCMLNVSLSNFTGVVYRGMALSDDDFEAFHSLQKQSLSDRYISVPLSLWSASTNLDVAKDFIETTLGIHPGNKPLLMKIHVIELLPEYLDLYRKKFPTSVVSTICAVDIRDLSDEPDEEEVLLRGSFCQVLDVFEGDPVQGEGCTVMEMVMLNSNRDHISTMQLGADSGPARLLFGTMVGATRCQFAVEFCTGRGLTDDAEAYKLMLEEKTAKLKELLS